MVKKVKILPYLILVLLFFNRVDAQLVSSSYFHFNVTLKDSVKYSIEDIKYLKLGTSNFLNGSFPNENPKNDQTLYSIHIKNQFNKEDIYIYFYVGERYKTVIPLRGIFEVILPENISKGTYCFNLYDSNFSESNIAVKKDYESSIDLLRKLKRNRNDKSQLEINQKIENAVYDLKSEFYRFYPVQLNGEYANNTVVEITTIGMSSNSVSKSIVTSNKIEEYINDLMKKKPEVIQKIHYVLKRKNKILKI
ncbi:MAG: hypothetical protein Q8K02_17165 [Flavobacterium sp.]|nr:hypothetical protein [Flavobacterium sp.]